MRTPSQARVAWPLLLILAAACSPSHSIPLRTVPDPPLVSSTPTSTPHAEPTTDPYLWRARGQVAGIHGGRVYVADAGRVAAFDLSCHANCEAVWRASVDDWPSDLAFYGDRVFVPAGEHGIAIFPSHCEEVPCRADSFIRFGVFDPDSSFDNARKDPPTKFLLDVTDDILYVVAELDLADTSGIQPGRVIAFDARCQAPCDPLWRGPVGRGLLQEPVVRDGAVYVPSSSGLSVFGVGCRIDGGMCSPLWKAPMNTDAFGMLMSKPLFRDDLVIELTQGYNGGGDADPPQIAAFHRDCRTDGGRCEPAWWFEIARERFASGPVIHDGLAYVTTAGANLSGMTFAFPLGCTGRCRPVRTYEASGAFFRGPAFVHGHLIVAPYQEGGVSYFDPSCEETCTPVETWNEGHSFSDLEALPDGIVIANRHDLLLFRSPRSGRWEPKWRWHGARRIDRLEIMGTVILFSTHGSTYAVQLPVHP